MEEDPLETVLRLVSEGRLTAQEALPILEALDGARGPKPGAAPGSSAPPPGFRPDAPSPPHAAGAGGSTGRSLRIEVREAGHSVVNLRLPLAMGRFAIDRIPGLSSDQTDRVRAALDSGLTGPVFVVDDGGDSVRIAIE